MRYNDEDIEFANLILTDRENLDDAEVDAWMEDPEHVKLLKEFATAYQVRMNKNFDQDKEEEFARLERDIYERKSRRMTLRWSVAASVILLVGLFVGRTVIEWRDLDDARVQAKTERNVPGAKAELILSTGKRVVLGRKNTVIESENEMGIRNDSVTGLDYATAKMEGKEIMYNTMRIPVGGFYQLALSDGSKVWLNSMTELRFPVTFAGEERKVYLTGEAYFEVAKDAKKPFTVQFMSSSVTVLGTSFNVMAYPDERHTEITLLKGAVVVEAAGRNQYIKPGQQVQVDNVSKEMNCREVNAGRYASWKDGLFDFEGMKLEDLAVELSRWYDVDFFFIHAASGQKKFTGAIKRNNSLQFMLDFIEKTSDVRFEVKENVVRVYNR